MRRKIAAGNWKLNGNLAFADALLGALEVPKVAGVEVLVFPPMPYVAGLAAKFGDGGIGFGAQDVSEHDKGAYTGEVAAAMLKEVGAGHALVGHSERRQYHGETDAIVAAKAQAALAAGITPIVCLGETLAQREAGETEAVVQRQLAAVLDVVGQDVTRLVVAYEPVWAIGTGKTATPEQAQAVHAALRAQLVQVNRAAAQVPLLYGGSMNAANAAQLLAQPDIDGGLIGGAALKAADFLHIIAAAA